MIFIPHPSKDSFFQNDGCFRNQYKVEDDLEPNGVSSCGNNLRNLFLLKNTQAASFQSVKNQQNTVAWAYAYLPIKDISH